MLHQTMLLSCRSSTGISALKVQYSSTKGFFLVVPEPQPTASSTFRSAGARNKVQEDVTPAELPKYETNQAAV